jgi:hypothetical protein
MKLPELTQTLMKAKTASEFADTLRKSWFGYGASDLQGNAFTITFKDKSVTPKTFYEAMAFLKFTGKAQDGARVYHLGSSPYQVTAVLAGDVMTVTVAEGTAEATKETALAFLHVYRERLKQNAPALDLEGMDAQ